MYDKRHGGPYDRGSADAWYGRPFDPHYYTGATYATERVEAKDMTDAEVAAYKAGYGETPMGKDWGTWDEPRNPEDFERW